MEDGKDIFDKIIWSLSQEFVGDLDLADYIPDDDEVSNNLEDFMNNVYPYIERLDEDDKDLLVEYLQKSADYDRDEYDDEIQWITDNINSAVSVEVKKILSKSKISSIDLEKVIRVAVREAIAEESEWVGKVLVAKEDGMIAVVRGEAHSAEIFKGQKFKVVNKRGPWLTCEMLSKGVFKSEPGFESYDYPEEMERIKRTPVKTSELLFGIDLGSPDSEYGGINNFEVEE